MKTVRASLKGIHSPDVLDLAGYQPFDGQGFGILLQAMYGPEDGDGAESFDITVCNPAWLEQKIAQQGIMIGRHLLVVNDFDLGAIRDFLSGFGRRCEGKNWQEVATQLSQIGRWEFEGYTE